MTLTQRSTDMNSISRVFSSKPMMISLLGANMRVILVPGASLKCVLFANQSTSILVFNFTVSNLPWGR